MNLHPNDLMDEDLYSSDAPLSRSAREVVLEITERASLDKVEDLTARVAALRAMGFRVAVDDLGAGYAGLSSFARLRPEVVKIDMSLVRNVYNDPTRQKLISLLTTLCAEIGMQVVAEGVETVEERKSLVHLGCDLLQGYLFAMPAGSFVVPRW